MSKTIQKTAKLLLSLSILLGATLSIGSTQAEPEFRSIGDGSIEFNDQRFNSLADYVGSQAFRDGGRRCGFDRMSKRKGNFFQQNKRQAKSAADCTNTFTRIKAEYNPTVQMRVPVWFHVISRTDGRGSISDSRINGQIQVLNEDFLALSNTLGAGSVNTKIEFVLAGVTRTVNNAWYTDSESDEAAYKAALNRDPSKFLNIYTNDSGGFLGFAYLPDGSAGTVRDGVVLLDGSVGGRNNGFGVYNQGRTAVHEVGHYLGLRHTFNGGAACSNTFSTGDYIVDTNAEREPFFGATNSCPSRSTCGTPDPVDNFMDYNRDGCMTRFTPQQVNRMICSAINYRPDLVTVVDGNNNIVPILDLLLDDA